MTIAKKLLEKFNEAVNSDALADYLQNAMEHDSEAGAIKYMTKEFGLSQAIAKNLFKQYTRDQMKIMRMRDAEFKDWITANMHESYSSYSDMKQNVFGSANIPDGYNGDFANVEFAYEPRSKKIFVVTASGYHLSALPLARDEEEAKWLLQKHPSARKYKNVKIHESEYTKEVEENELAGLQSVQAMFKRVEAKPKADQLNFYKNYSTKLLNLFATETPSAKSKYMALIKEVKSELKDMFDGMEEAVTTISFKQDIDKISNFSKLPKEIQKEIRDAKTIESKGFQELLGYDGRQLLWSLGGSWTGQSDDKFEATSYGSKQWQWDGKTLRPTKK